MQRIRDSGVCSHKWEVCTTPSSQAPGSLQRGWKGWKSQRQRVFCIQQVSYTEEFTVDTQHAQDPSFKPDIIPAWSREVGTVAKEILAN